MLKKIQAIFSEIVPVLKWSVTILVSVTIRSVTIMSVYNTLNSSSALNREYVKNFDIAFTPLLNPDGYEWSEFSVQIFFNHFFYRFSIIKIYQKNLQKREDLRNFSDLQGVTLLWHVVQWVSCAPPNNTLPAFLNPHGSPKIFSKIKILNLFEAWPFVGQKSWRFQ